MEKKREVNKLTISNMKMMELIDKLQEHYKDFSKRMRGRIYYDDQETKTLLDGYTEELVSFFSKGLSKAREEGSFTIEELEVIRELCNFEYEKYVALDLEDSAVKGILKSILSKLKQ